MKPKEHKRQQKVCLLAAPVSSPCPRVIISKSDSVPFSETEDQSTKMKNSQHITKNDLGNF